VPGKDDLFLAPGYYLVDADSLQKVASGRRVGDAADGEQTGTVVLAPGEALTRDLTVGPKDIQVSITVEIVHSGYVVEWATDGRPGPGTIQVARVRVPPSTRNKIWQPVAIDVAQSLAMRIARIGRVDDDMLKDRRLSREGAGHDHGDGDSQPHSGSREAPSKASWRHSVVTFGAHHFRGDRAVSGTHGMSSRADWSTSWRGHPTRNPRGRSGEAS